MEREASGRPSQNQAIQLSQSTGPIFILIAALLWSLSGLLIKFVPWHAMAIASGRSLLAALFFLAVYRSRLIQRPNRITWMSGFMLALTYIGFIVANKLTTATNAIMLQYVSPFFIVILGALIYHNLPSLRELIALVLASLGIVLFFLDDLSPGNMTGNLVALCSGLTVTFVYLFNNQQKCDVPAALFIAQLITFLSGFPFLLEVKEWRLMPIAVIIFLGIIQLGLSYLLFGIGIRITKPLSANLIAMVEPIANPLWVFLALHERPGISAIIGAGIIISAVLYLNIGKLRRIKSMVD